jgi:hypothetical protein
VLANIVAGWLHEWTPKASSEEKAKRCHSIVGDKLLFKFHNTWALRESNLGCAHIGGKSTYAISCVSPTTAYPTPPPSVTYTSFLRDRCISIHIDRCAPVTIFV